MAIFQGSRFSNSYLYEMEREGREPIIHTGFIREILIEPELDDYRVTFTAGMRIDLLAYEYYGDSDYDWVIMDANPKYMTPLDIKIGDILVIPRPERVLNID